MTKDMVPKRNMPGAASTLQDLHSPPPGYSPPIVCDSIAEQRDVMVAMRDGKRLCVDIYRPDMAGRFPALLAIAPHNKEFQTPEFAEAAQGSQPAWARMWFGGAEGGDTDYLVRRGYVHVCGNIRGTGKSDGGGSPEWDIYDLIEWIAAQPWCDGKVGMIGISAFGGAQFEAAAQQPPALKAILPLRSARLLRRGNAPRHVSGWLDAHNALPARPRRRLSHDTRPAGIACRRQGRKMAGGDEQPRLSDVSEHLQHPGRKGADHAPLFRPVDRSLRSRRSGCEVGRAIEENRRFLFIPARAGTHIPTSCTCRARSSISRRSRACRKNCC